MLSEDRGVPHLTSPHWFSIEPTVPQASGVKANPIAQAGWHFSLSLEAGSRARLSVSTWFMDVV